LLVFLNRNRYFLFLADATKPMMIFFPWRLGGLKSFKIAFWTRHR